jgi:hypothetical protein
MTLIPSFNFSIVAFVNKESGHGKYSLEGGEMQEK